MTFLKSLKKLTAAIWSNGQTNNLWQRIIKCSIACTASVIMVITPQAVAVFGPSTFLAPMTTVFAHPGQRLGMMIEALLMIIVGSGLGLAWSIFGLFLSSLVVHENPAGGYAIRAVFLLIAVLFHGYLRSASPRLFLFVAFMLIAVCIVLLGQAQKVTLSTFTSVYYPILAGGAIVTVVNLLIFPELSSSFLGLSTIDALCETLDALTRATHWFVSPGGDPERLADQLRAIRSAATVRGVVEKPKSQKKKGFWRKFLDEFPNPFQSEQGRFQVSSIPVHLTSIAGLTARKAKLRTRLARCKAAQKEVNYEISIAPLPPSSLKPLSTSYMSDLVQNAITVIGACENKFIVLENDDRSMGEDLTTVDTAVDSLNAEDLLRVSTKEDYLRKLADAKPTREIETSSAAILESVLERIREPVQELQESLKEAVVLVATCLAYCYDVPKLPSGALTPNGIHLEELDLRIDTFTEAISQFDTRCSEELRWSAMDDNGQSVNFMPRMETFLVSSFLLAIRQSAMHILQMLRHMRSNVEQRQARNDRSKVWFPRHTSIRQWLTTGGESGGMVLPAIARKEVRRGQNKPGQRPETRDDPESSESLVSPKPKDEEFGVEPISRKKTFISKGKAPKKPKQALPREKSWFLRLRSHAADTLEWIQDSDDLAFAIKLAIALFSVSWPAFVTSWNGWYAQVRGVWAPLQLMLVFEVAIGTSFFIFFVRLSGVVFGCVLGYLSYEIGRGNKIAMVIILIFGIVPSFYVQLGTKFVKAGMVGTVTMVVVALATLNGNGTAYENFYKRLSAFVIGGSIALLVEMLLYPVRARHRLLESLSTSVREVQNMQAAIAVGIDGPVKPDLRSPHLHTRFCQARGKARGALAAAETFLPFCSIEPRLKGSFKPLAPIYKEIIYVLHQIIDRMDNMIQLRKEYGSSVLEDLNPKVHAYRRNAAASIMLVLFSVNEALTTWQPLPQFIPSGRLAQLRLVNHIREVLASRSGTQTPAGGAPSVFNENGELDIQVAQLITQRRFMSWNASTAGQMEIIEYLEELVELVKLLVGVNAFRSGLLEKPDYSNYRLHVKMDNVPHASIPALENVTPAPLEEVATAPAGFPSVEGRPPALRRTTTLRERAEHLRHKLKKERDEKVDENESEEDDEVPMSLQRVGTRMCENNTVVRRRAFTLSHEPIDR